MPLYYFDLHDGAIYMNNAGKALATLDAVREEAHRLAFAVASGHALQRDAAHLRVNVRNGFEARVFTGKLMFLIEAPDE